jgi:hypothetical protein
LLVEGGVNVVEEAVADVVGVAGGGGDGGPDVKFLGDGSVAVVVTGEGIKGCGDSLVMDGDCIFPYVDLPPRVAQRAQSVSVVFPPKPQMSEPTMGIWKNDAKLSICWICHLYCSQVLKQRWNE